MKVGLHYLGRRFYNIQIRDIVSAGETCIDKFISCDDYSSFPAKNEDQQEMEITKCIEEIIRN